MSAYDEIKATWDIPRLWRALSLPGEPPARDSVKFASPFRADVHPSMSLSKGRKYFQDWSTGDRGDVAEFYALATGCQKRKAIPELMKFLEGRGEIINHWRPPAKVPAIEPPKPPKTMKEPETNFPTDWQCRELANLRHLKASTFKLAANYGCLEIGTVLGYQSWILRDKKGLAAEARRLDGNPYPEIGEFPERKTHTLRGSDKSWPVGLMTNLFTVNAIKAVVIGEGSAAYFELLELIVEYSQVTIQPCVFLGANVRSVHPEALKMFSWKERIVILPDNDEAGRTAAGAWERMLQILGRPIKVFHWPATWPHKDLGEFLASAKETDKAWLAKEVLT